MARWIDWCHALLIGLALLVLGHSASAHDLAIDQVLLSPDLSSGVLRGEVTFDPELTRGRGVQPSREDEERVVAFLGANLKLVVDGRATALSFEIRELWVAGGATPGDVVGFAVPLSKEASELRLFAGDAFRALVVSVQRVTASEIDTASWLVSRGEWTPVYRIGLGWQQPGWRAGGPDVFLDVVRPHDAANGAASPAALAARFVRLGFEHILPHGIDHMLFVAGLVLGSARRYRQVLISLTLFTLAHSVTLALGNFQIYQASPRIVEPLIALSIVFLGLDNLRIHEARGNQRVGGRYGLVFFFGLVHGLGFASALSEFAFDRDHAVLALLSFNVGVELGQIAVVALLSLLLYLIRERHPLERRAILAGSAAIAASGLFMIFDRIIELG